MTFQDAIEIVYENQTHHMIDEMYKEDPDPDLDVDTYEPNLDIYEIMED